MLTNERRYDIDWLRVIAIGLLLLYHTAICVQPWGVMIGFISNDQPWSSLWFPMAMLNVWRIPLLFFVSGMGVFFAIQNRNWQQLLKERTLRILIPYVFAIFVIVPMHWFIWQHYYHYPLAYNPGPAHVWFLGNIFLYVLIFLPFFFYCKNNQRNKVIVSIKKIFSTPFCLLLIIGLFMLEVVLVKPFAYEVYAMTWHGFFLGMVAFLAGFLLVFSGTACWNMLLKGRWIFLAAAISLYIFRLRQPMMKVPDLLLTVESNAWIFTMFAFGYRYLNFSNRALRYLSQAAYPVYILHMIFLFAGCWLFFPLSINVYLKFILVLLFTITGCFIFYEFIIRRIKFIRPLFGLKSGT
ncbi:MAG: acyltransferase [Chitinophagaceae bacterium]|nr:MAG: acyltransferase [Chitinophagaceae bacterium]